MLQTTHTLRPGLLVSLNTSVRGNVSYQKVQLENAHVTSNGEERARWETTRVTTDPEEHDRAIKVRSKVRSLITGVCSNSAFGLLCPENKYDELQVAITEARQLADKFNGEARLTYMSVNVLTGRIAQDDVEAVAAISGELRSLMEDMQDGLKAMDVKAVRDAANKAREVGEMLTPDAKGRLDVAIQAARKEARKIVKAGEVIGTEIDRVALEKIDRARTSFLDLGTEVQVATPEMDARGVDFDFDFDEPVTNGAAAPAVSAPELEIDA